MIVGGLGFASIVIGTIWVKGQLLEVCVTKILSTQRSFPPLSSIYITKISSLSESPALAVILICVQLLRFPPFSFSIVFFSEDIGVFDLKSASERKIFKYTLGLYPLGSTALLIGLYT